MRLRHPTHGEATKAANRYEANAALKHERIEIERLGVALAERDVQAAKLSAALAERNRELMRLTPILEKARERERQLDELVAKRSAELEKLEHERNEIAATAHRGHEELIKHFRSSTSWRVTSPLRALRGLLSHSFITRQPITALQRLGDLKRITHRMHDTNMQARLIERF